LRQKFQRREESKLKIKNYKPPATGCQLNKAGTKMKNIIHVTLLMLLTVTASAQMQWQSPWGEAEQPPEVRVISSSQAELTLEVSIFGFYMEAVERTEGIFQRIRLEHSIESVTELIAAPELPQIARLIEIPRNYQAVVTVTPGVAASLENIMPYPRQKPSTDDQVSGEFSFDREIYEAVETYPANLGELQDVGIWRDLQVGSLKIRPLSFIGKEKKLEVYRSMTIKVEFVPSADADFILPAGGISPVYGKQYASSLINYDAGTHTTDDRDEEVGIKYVIICEDRAYDYIQPLAEFRNRMGLRTVVAVADSNLNTASEIKLYLTSLYFSDGLEYALMVGNPNINTGTPEVPMYYWTYNPENMTYSESWYSCLVPGGDADHYPEIAVGRITYDNLNDLQHIVDKTMNYLTEYDVSEDWFQKSLLVAHQEEYPLKYTQCKETIRTTNYSIQNPVFSTIYGGAGGNNNQVVNYVNLGSCGLLNYRGHGSETTWPAWGTTGSFTASNINQMTNQNRLFIIFDVCCSNNDVVNFTGDCLAESFMQAAYGAAAIHGAIMPSYTEPNHIFDIKFYQAIYNQGITNIGYASNYAHIETINDFGGLGRDNFRMYFWQGDPAIDIWTHTPAQPEITLLDSLIVGTYNFQVYVTVAGSPAEGALVCLQNGEIYGRAYTGADGIAHMELYPSLMLAGDAYLTVSGHNIAFRSDTLNIGGGMGTVQGNVYRQDNSAFLENVVVSIEPYGFSDTTDATGYYSFGEVPAYLAMEMQVYHPDYFPDTLENMTLTPGETQTHNFYLLHAECNPSVGQIEQSANPGAVSSWEFTAANGGDGILDYTAEITGNGAGATLQSRMTMYVSTPTGDNDFYGIAFDGENFWLSGSGDASGNKIYKFDTEGNLISSFLQPQSVSELGFYGLCWNGYCLLGVENADITAFDREGNFLYTISTNLNPVKGIAYNPADGHYFIAGGISDIREIDSLGTVIDTYNHSLDITGLCWDGVDEEGMYLYIYSMEPTVTISKMDPLDGNIEEVGMIMGMPDNTSGGCVISEEVNPLYKLFFGVYKSSGTDKIKGWQLDRLFYHFNITPAAGNIVPQESESFTLEFNPENLDLGVYDAIIRFEHNGFGAVTEIPVNITLTDVGVDGGMTQAAIPTQFRIYPNYPNPFNPVTKIGYDVPVKGTVEFTIYDILGREVEHRLAEIEAPGKYELEFDGTALSSGIYFCQMEAGEFKAAVKMVLIK